MSKLNVCFIGGGHGLSSTLKACKGLDINIHAIVGVSDDGGSSGRLRNKYNCIPPGDIRLILSSMSQLDDELINILNYRFKMLDGHPLGNIMITGILNESMKDVNDAMDYICNIFQCKGSVIPISQKPLNLSFTYNDGIKFNGESDIKAYLHGGIKEFVIHDFIPNIRAIEVILKSDIIIYCPGSIYSSLLCNLAHEEIINALDHSKAYKIYLANIFSDKEESYGMSLNDHINLIASYIGDKNINLVIANNHVCENKELLEKYQKEGKILVDNKSIDIKNQKKILFYDMLFISSNKIFHSITKRKKILEKIIKKFM